MMTEAEKILSHAVQKMLNTKSELIEAGASQQTIDELSEIIDRLCNIEVKA